MEGVRQKLSENLNKNTVVLESILCQTQDMRRYLKKRDCIVYVDCADLIIIIDSVINRIEFKGCSGIDLRVKGMISGLLIEHSNNIQISSSRIPAITVSRSKDITIDNRSKRTVYTDIDRSHNISFSKYRKN